MLIRRSWTMLVGIVLGLALAFWGMSLIRTAPRVNIIGRIAPESGGAIQSMVMQYVKGSKFVWPVYQQFLGQMPPDVKVYFVCPNQDDFDEIKDTMWSVRCKLVPVIVRHEMTVWSRDRWLPMLSPTSDKLLSLLAPRDENQQEIWPQRAGDAHVVSDLAKILQPTVTWRRSDLYFDGGDFLADGPYVFVAPSVLARNLQKTMQSKQDIVAGIRMDLQREPVVLETAPDHHVGMFMMTAGQGRMVVADITMGQQFFDPNDQTVNALPGGADFTWDTKRRFDSVAAEATARGYRVSRIPVVPASESKTYLTYVNVILDQRDGKRIVYMPVYERQDAMNAAATKVWESLGYEVRPVDCTTVFQRGGTLHCLVNILQRQS